MSSHVIHCLLRLNEKQQLLAVWNRAKGKERDALLWGDEVRDSNVLLYVGPYDPHILRLSILS